MMPETSNKTYLEQYITIEPNQSNDYSFPGKSPNHVSLTNATDGPIYVGTSSSTDPTHFDLMVPAGSTLAFGKAGVFNTIYMYHSGTTTCTARLISWYEEFTINSIPKSTQVINTTQLTGEMAVSSLPPTPAGTSHIGSVDIDTVNGIVQTELTGPLVSSNGLKVDMGNSTVNITNATIDQVSSKTGTINFHTNETAISDGTALAVSNYKTLTVEVTGTSSGHTIEFIGEGPSGTKIPLMGTNISTLANATSTTGLNELWQFDVTGITTVLMSVTAVNSSSLTVNGTVVA